jgi:cystathionine gamma-lyase
MYSRFNNPTRKAFEDCVAKLEGGEYGLAFSSGMGATASIINMLNAGDHVITIDDVYGGTNEYFRSIATKAGDLSFSFVDLPKEGEFEKHITPKTKLLWMETPTNPTLKISDIQKLCKIAHKHGIVVVVDNTFASPYLQSPLELGADIVMHSVTKYINGHSDVVMGVLAMKDQKLFEKLKSIQGMVGAVPSPFDCYMALRGLKTLHVRMERHQKNATVVANFLDGHPKVEKVIYPGLKSHPGHEIAKKQMRGFGGMVSFFLKGGLEESRIFLENLKVFTLAVSLGSVESLAEHP